MRRQRKSNNTYRKEKHSRDTAAAAIGQLTECLLMVVVLAVCVAVPLYARDGYHQIGVAKFAIYRRIMTGGFGMLLLMAAAYCVCRITAYRGKTVGGNPLSCRELRTYGVSVFSNMSSTDKFMSAYLVLTGISIVSGGFYEDAFWGSAGWNMGFYAQLSFVLLYLFLSRFGRYYRVLLITLCVVAVIVFGIGILHRLMFDPIGFYEGLTGEQKAQFLSTLGQATWYASFLMVVLPVMMGTFLYAEQAGWRLVSGLCMMLGFCTLVTQNSDSAYFALAGALLVFFMLACEKRVRLCRFMMMLTLFFAAGKIMYFLIALRPNPALEPDLITELMWTSGLTWILFGISLASTMLLGWQSLKRTAKDESYASPIVRKVRRGTLVIVIGFLVMIVLVICLQSRGMLPAGISGKLSEVSYLNWNDAWGNGRGRIWSFSGRMIAGESLLHRLFGVGPDCFGSYADACYREEVQLLWGKKVLTNAHNEWLTSLINGGLLGGAAYLGIYVTAVARFLRGSRQNFLLAGIAAACVSYMCYNFFCYQQVLCTPFIFILMGIGEYIMRSSGNPSTVIVDKNGSYR